VGLKRGRPISEADKFGENFMGDGKKKVVDEKVPKKGQGQALQ